MKKIIIGLGKKAVLIQLLLTLVACATPQGVTANEGKGADVNPRVEFEKLSKRKKQIWVVGYTNGTIEDCIRDLDVTFANGGDAIVYEGSDYRKLDQVLAAVRKQYPDKLIGVNYLGATISYIETFELAKKHKLQIAWTDYSGIDLVTEAPEISLHNVDLTKPEGVFYVSGIHMKYLTLRDENKSIEKSARQAMGWMDGVTITGPGTGQATDPEKARRTRVVLGDHPMGAASGVSPENVETILPYIDYMLVNSSISSKDRRIIPERLKALRDAISAYEQKQLK
jgi:hypothetical protein